MKGTGIIILLITMIIVGIVWTKQRTATVKMSPEKEVQLHELPKEVKIELDQANIQTEKRIDEGEEQE